jgi:signal transduction histidine kinase
MVSAALLLGGWAMALLGGALALRGWRAEQRRREAVARACHELRGPLTAIQLGLALEERAGRLPAARLQALESELARATLAVRDLTPKGPAAAVGSRRRVRARGRGGARRTGPAHAARAAVALGPLLEVAIAAASGQAAAAGATISGGWEGPPASVWGDRLRLAQALANLLANAVEHGGGHVRVRGELRGPRARITVEDDGPGLPAPVADLARRPRGGRGARGRGLAIATSVAQAHAGSLAAAPVAQGGRIVLTLPARAAGDAGSAYRS